MSFLPAGLFYAPSSGAALLLDLIGTAAKGAFSTRKVRAAYAGSCIRVRESGGNTESNIGFSANLLDTTALLAFTGANDGFIVTWYDQSGNGQDVTQATTANQPKIVSAGVVITTINSKPSLQFDGTNDLLTGVAISNYISVSAYSVLNTTRPASGAGNQNTSKILAGDSTAGYIWFTGFGTTGGDKVWSGHYDTGYNNVSFAITYPSTHVFATYYDGVNISANLDGGVAVTDAASNVGDAASNLAIGRGDTNLFDGASAEIILYNASLSTSDLNLLGNSMATYAGTTWTNI